MDSVKQRIPDETCVLTRPGTRYKKMIWKFEEPRKLTERDVLNKIINAKKYPAKDPTKDMVRYYGSSARAIIHTPENFNIPDMIIQACHWNKQHILCPE